MSDSYKIKYYDNKKEKLISGIITILISVAILSFILTYKTVFLTVTPPAYIDINFDMDDLGANFGNDEVGLGDEEPIDQDVLLGDGREIQSAATHEDNKSFNDSKQQDENKPILANQNDSKDIIPQPTKKTESKKKDKPKLVNKDNLKSSPTKSNSKSVSSAGNKNATGGSPKGNAALGNLIKGKGAGTSSTGEGTGGRPGQNQGVEIGGNGNGGEGIGNGRKLVSFIPGTMGRGGKVPEHNCNGSGTIIFSYILDKSGNVISVNRKSGINNTCLFNTGVKWIKQYVKGNEGTRSVTGTYKINF